MSIEQVYGVTGDKIIDSLCAIDNMFIRQVAMLAKNQVKDGKVVAFVIKDKLSKRGEVAKRGMKASEKSVVDLGKLGALVGYKGARSLIEEIATYRADRIHTMTAKENFIKRNMEILMIDYLLATSLCYVEVFDSAGNVDKFLATRNRKLAGNICNLEDSETTKFAQYLQTYETNYEKRQLKVLKINNNKTKGFTITQPRAFVDFNKTVKVTPLFLMSLYIEGLNDILTDNILSFTYIKDNLTEREFVTTLSPRILITTYGEEMAQKMMGGVSTQLDRGYIKLPELGISKHDPTGVRSLNISRITSVKKVEDFDRSFIEVDFNRILPYFKNTIELMRDTQAIGIIHNDLLKTYPTNTTVIEAKQAILNFVEQQYRMGTTTALRQFHKYMMIRKELFPTYNGGVPDVNLFKTDSFNLGGA